jgi:hypothetical protein
MHCSVRRLNCFKRVQIRSSVYSPKTFQVSSGMWFCVKSDYFSLFQIRATFCSATRLQMNLDMLLGFKTVLFIPQENCSIFVSQS